ncbi:MAG TPA: hypothetical protein VGM83_12715 [Devosiaceae bacterium]|jgi:probable HAF family extracellular repeat protein
MPFPSRHHVVAQVPLKALLLLLLSGTALSAYAGHALAVDATVTGVDITGFDVDELNDVNDAGTSVGDASLNSNPRRTPFYWTIDGTAHLIPSNSQLEVVDPNAISADGNTIVGLWDDGQVNHDEAFAYRLGDQAVTILPGLGSDTQAQEVTPDGSTIVGQTKATQNGPYEAAVWTGAGWSTLTVLPSYVAGYQSVASSVSDDGATIAGLGADANGLHAIYWRNGVLSALDPADQQSIAEDVSGDGSTIVGFATSNGTVADAVSWSGPNFSTKTTLGSLGGAYSIATGVNSDGTIIVGASALSSNMDLHAFRYADGQIADLNTLLTDAGVDLGTKELSAATSISPNGKYITVLDQVNELSYLVYYADDQSAGITDPADEQASVNNLERSRQTATLQQDAYFGILMGDLDRSGAGNQVGAFGLVGSAVGGVRGTLNLAPGWSVTGGIADGTSDFGGTGIDNALYGALALRYDASAVLAGFHPFVEAGAGVGMLNGLALHRSYSSGEGVGKTDGTLGMVFGRAGLSQDFASGDQLAFAAELGGRWLSTDGYSEAASASNPFPISVSDATDRSVVAKLSATWTHPFGKSVDLTVRAALGASRGDSSLKAATLGFGTLAPAVGDAVWGELGAHLDMKISAQSSIDLFATTIMGGDGGATHVGAGYHYSF